MPHACDGGSRGRHQHHRVTRLDRALFPPRRTIIEDVRSAEVCVVDSAFGMVVRVLVGCDEVSTGFGRGTTVLIEVAR